MRSGISRIPLADARSDAVPRNPFRMAGGARGPRLHHRNPRVVAHAARARLMPASAGALPGKLLPRADGARRLQPHLGFLVQAARRNLRRRREWILTWSKARPWRPSFSISTPCYLVAGRPPLCILAPVRASLGWRSLMPLTSSAARTL